ncbi:MAG: hypothetical protein AAF414_24135 [Pseudomonadota bacterium]
MGLLQFIWVLLSLARTRSPDSPSRATRRVIGTRPYEIDVRNAVRDHFNRLTGLLKNFNYAAKDGPDYGDLLRQIDDMAASVER